MMISKDRKTTRSGRGASGMIMVAFSFFAGIPLSAEDAGDRRMNVEYPGGLNEVPGATLGESGAGDVGHPIANKSPHGPLDQASRLTIENLEYARKVHEALPYLGEKLDDALWRDWVLPYRVNDEDLCSWRKCFYEQMQPVVDGKQTTKAVADAIIEWLWLPDEDGETRIRFGKAENRTKTPLQMLEMREGACGELNGVYVLLLRSVGIPARLSMAGWWYHKNDRHFYCEYWDNQLKQWIAWDSSDNLALRSATPAARQASGAWNSLVMHAHPSTTSKKDVFNTESWEDCIRVTRNVGETYPVNLEGAGEWETAKAYVWNLGGWRCIDVAMKERRMRSFEFGATSRVDRPVLFTATVGETLYWGMKRAEMGMGAVKLEKMEAGMCLKWKAGIEE